MPVETPSETGCCVYKNDDRFAAIVDRCSLLPETASVSRKVEFRRAINNNDAACLSLRDQRRQGVVETDGIRKWQSAKLVDAVAEKVLAGVIDETDS